MVKGGFFTMRRLIWSILLVVTISLILPFCVFAESDVYGERRILKGDLYVMLSVSLDLAQPYDLPEFADLDEESPYYKPVSALLYAGLLNMPQDEDGRYITGVSDLISNEEGADIISEAYARNSEVLVFANESEPIADIEEEIAVTNQNVDSNKSSLQCPVNNIVVRSEEADDKNAALPKDADCTVLILDKQGKVAKDKYLSDFKSLTVEGGNINGNLLKDEIPGISVKGNTIKFISGEAFENSPDKEHKFVFRADASNIEELGLNDYSFEVNIKVIGKENPSYMPQAFLYEAGKQISNKENIQNIEGKIIVKNGFANLYNPKLSPEIEGISLSVSGDEDLVMDISPDTKNRLAKEAIEMGKETFDANLTGLYNEREAYAPVHISVDIEAFITDYIVAQIDYETQNLIENLPEPTFSFNEDNFVFTYPVNQSESGYLNELTVSDGGSGKISYNADKSSFSIAVDPDKLNSSEEIFVKVRGRNTNDMLGSEIPFSIKGYGQLTDAYKVYKDIAFNKEFEDCSVTYNNETGKWELLYGPFVGTNGNGIKIDLGDGNIAEAENGFVKIQLDTLTPIAKAGYEDGMVRLETKINGAVPFKLSLADRPDISFDGEIPLTPVFAQKADKNLAGIREELENFTGELYNGGEAVVLEEGKINAKISDKYNVSFTPGSGDARTISYDKETGTVMFETSANEGKGNYSVTISYGDLSIPAGFFEYEYGLLGTEFSEKP